MIYKRCEKCGSIHVQKKHEICKAEPGFAERSCKRMGMQPEDFDGLIYWWECKDCHHETAYVVETKFEVVVPRDMIEHFEQDVIESTKRAKAASDAIKAEMKAMELADAKNKTKFVTNFR